MTEATCPSCDKTRPLAIGLASFAPDSVCPSCGHVETKIDYIEVDLIDQHVKASWSYAEEGRNGFYDPDLAADDASHGPWACVNCGDEKNGLWLVYCERPECQEAERSER